MNKFLLGLAIGLSFTFLAKSKVEDKIDGSLIAKSITPPSEKVECAPSVERIYFNSAQNQKEVSSQVGQSAKAVGRIAALPTEKTETIYSDKFIEALWNQEIPTGKRAFEEARHDGTYLVIEDAETDGTISKVFENGELTLVEWNKPDGAYLVRTYYEDRSPKGISFGSRPKENLINITYARSGNPTYKLVPSENGTKHVTKFNEYGEPYERWIITADGRQIRGY